MRGTWRRSCEPARATPAIVTLATPAEADAEERDTGYAKYDRLVREAFAEHLVPGEQIRVVATSTVKQVTAKRMVATAAAAAVLTAGMLTVHVAPKKFFVVLTDRRLVFLGGNELTGRPNKKIVMELPVQALTVQSLRTKRVLLLIPSAVLEVAVAGSDKGLWMQFPTPCRDRAADIARWLGAPS